TRHARPARHTSRDNNEFDAVKGLAEVLLGVARHLGGRTDVGKVCSNARRTANIVAADCRHQRIVLHQEGKGLANATSGTKDGNLAEAGGRSAHHRSYFLCIT
ncbi:hypothetical protein TraAM80_09302, partial [Trypanosoma rangeli]